MKEPPPAIGYQAGGTSATGIHSCYSKFDPDKIYL